MKKFFLNIWQALKNIKYFDFMMYAILYAVLERQIQSMLFRFHTITSKSTSEQISNMAEGFALIMATRAEYKKIVNTNNEEVSE